MRSYSLVFYLSIRRSVWLLLFALVAMPVNAAETGTGALIAAASSLRALWPSLIEQYVKDTGEPAPRVSFASSGLLSSQIRHGAPFELFLSADIANVQVLQELSLTRDHAIEFASGSLMLVASPTSPFAADLSLQSVARHIASLSDDTQPSSAETFRITMPSPVHAPYGKAAKAALEHVSAWPIPDGYLLAAENAAQALQFVNTEAVDIGIVPSSLVISSTGSWKRVSIPDTAYTPVSHSMVRLLQSSSASEHFFDWLPSESAGKVLNEYGLQSLVGNSSTQ